MSYFPFKSYVFFFFWYLGFGLWSRISDCHLSKSHQKFLIDSKVYLTSGNICSHPLLLTNWLTSVEMFSQRNKVSLSCRRAPERLDKKNGVDNICWNLYIKKIMWRRARSNQPVESSLAIQSPLDCNINCPFKFSPARSVVSLTCLCSAKKHRPLPSRSSFQTERHKYCNFSSKISYFCFSLVLLLFSDVLIVLVYKHALQSTSKKRKPKKRQK